MDGAEGFLIASRAIHFGAAMVLFGEMLFAWFFASGEANVASAVGRRGTTASSSQMRFFRVAVVAWACLMVSGASWLALAAIQMSGRSLAALDGAILRTVLGSTIFGRTWLVRTVLALVLAGMSPVLFTRPIRRRWALIAILLAGALLASLAWSGHANAQVGAQGAVHHLSDSAHLLAAGAWLGGLAPLAALLRQPDPVANRRALVNCAKTAARFGNAAALCVGALILSGIVNACYLLPDWNALLETTYGRLLLLKICAFVVMLAIAVVNRKRLTPALHLTADRPGTTTAAARSLRRNALAEQLLGAAVILLVAALGVLPPPMRM